MSSFVEKGDSIRLHNCSGLLKIVVIFAGIGFYGIAKMQ